MARKKTTDLTTCDTDQLFKLANSGNVEALERLKQEYRDKPELARLYGNLSRSGRESRLTQLMGKDSEGSKLAVSQRMQDMLKQIAGDNPTPLERLLAERIAMCWLDVQDHEHRYAQLGNDTLTKYEWRSRMLDRAHKRYLSAIKALAFVRKLGVPAIQVNIADKQINTVGDIPTTDRQS